MRVLLSGYTCDPNGGSEAANTWYTALELARAGADVQLLTREHDRPRVEPALAAVDGRLRVQYLPDRARVSRGQVGVYARYVAFQRQVSKWTDEHQGWDVGHHVSWGSINHPVGLAGHVERLIVGPVGGGQILRPELARWVDGQLGWNRMRNAALRIGPQLNPWSRSIARHADVLFVANEDTRRLAVKMGAHQVEFMIPDGVRDMPSIRGVTDPQKVVWIGRFLPIKAAGLALAAFRRVLREVPDAQLVFVGDGPTASRVRDDAADLTSAGRVRFTGQLPWPKAQEELATARVHLFTSVRDSFSAQAIEAAALGVPTIGLRLGGLAAVEDGQAVELLDPMPAPALDERLGTLLSRVLGESDVKPRQQASLRLAHRNTYVAKCRRLRDAYASSVG